MLWIFGDLLRMNVTTSHAGSIACACFGEFHMHDDVQAVRIVQMPEDKFSVAAIWQDEALADSDRSTRTFGHQLIFNIAYIRSFVQQSLESERDNAVVGD